MSTRQLAVERMTPESFAPFGQVIAPPDRKPDFEGLSGTQLWGLDFETDGRLQVGYVRVPYQRLSFQLMEQHFGVTQSFIPVAGPPAVIAVAAVILTDWETSDDLLASSDRLGAKLTRAIDFEKLYGVVFEFDLQQIR